MDETKGDKGIMYAQLKSTTESVSLLVRTQKVQTVPFCEQGLCRKLSNASMANWGGWKSGSPKPNWIASSPAISNIRLTPVGRMLLARSEKRTMCI